MDVPARITLEENGRFKAYIQTVVDLQGGQHISDSYGPYTPWDGLIPSKVVCAE